MRDEAVTPRDQSDEQAGGDEPVVVIENSRAMVRRQSGALAPRRRAGLPAPVAKAAVAVAAGAALQVGIGVVGKYLAYRAANGAARSVGTRALRAASKDKRDTRPAKQSPDAPFDNVAAVTETLIIRRTWIRRGRG